MLAQRLCELLLSSTHVSIGNGVGGSSVAKSKSRRASYKMKIDGVDEGCGWGQQSAGETARAGVVAALLALPLSTLLWARSMVPGEMPGRLVFGS